MSNALRLLTKPELVSRMQATARVQLNDDEFDFNQAAILRSWIEAAGLTGSQLYVDLGKVMDLFDRSKNKGVDLDRRGLEFGAAIFEDMRRRAASASVASVLVGDGTVRRTARLTADVAATATTFTVDDATSWPTSGQLIIERTSQRSESIVFTRSGTTITVVSPAGGLVNPHLASGAVETTAVKSVLAAGISSGAASANLAAGTEGAWPSSGSVIFERSSVRREIRTFTRVGVVLTLGAVTTFAHGISTEMTLSTTGADRPISAETVVFVPESLSTKRIPYRTKEAATLFDGDFVTALIPVESDDVGSQTRCGANTLTKWQSEPFANATVTNPNASSNGRDQEDDDSYNARISAFIQSLSRATALAIETLTAGQQDPFTERTIAFAQTVEPVAPGEAQLYVSDGTTTFSIDFQLYAGRDILVSDARVDEKRARLHSYGPFQMVANPVGQRTPRIFRSEATGSGIADLVGVNFIEDSTKSWTVNQWAGFEVKSDDGQFYPIVSNTAIRLTLSGGATPSLGQYAILDFTADPLIPGTDYTFNMSNGDLELAVVLQEHEALVAADDGNNIGAYTYSRGLAAHAQRLVNGDRTALNDFPGIKALGTHCRVVAPTVVTPDFTIQVVPNAGIVDASLASTVKTAVVGYVNGLGIGVKPLLAEIIRIVKGIPGVFDCRIISPTNNPSVSDGQIPRINDTNVLVV